MATLKVTNLKVTEQFNSSDAVDVLADAIASLTGGPAAIDAAIIAKKAAMAAPVVNAL